MGRLLFKPFNIVLGSDTAHISFSKACSFSITCSLVSAFCAQYQAVQR
jgi:hypothetical protein